MPGWMEGTRQRQAMTLAPKVGNELMPPATWHSHDAIEALQATLLAGHLAAKPQCLLHALSLGQAEDDRGIEGVTGPQSIYHPGWWESVGVEQLSIGAQGIGALLSPGTDERSPFPHTIVQAPQGLH